ncbi:MAG: START domain-containing protein, partial [Gammaproteobacteria bacterium]|nr:START domain-containing protein [Gammaproteobacteria bacterium]
MRIVTMVALMIMSELCIASIENISEDKKILWQKITEENGVVVYSQEIKGSDIVRVKAQIVIDVEMEKIQSFLDDLMYRKKWVPYLSEVRLLREYSATERLEYSHFSAPWPASDRDFVYRQKL